MKSTSLILLATLAIVRLYNSVKEFYLYLYEPARSLVEGYHRYIIISLYIYMKLSRTYWGEGGREGGGYIAI